MPSLYIFTVFFHLFNSVFVDCGLMTVVILKNRDKMLNIVLIENIGNNIKRILLIGVDSREDVDTEFMRLGVVVGQTVFDEVLGFGLPGKPKIDDFHNSSI